TLSSIVHLSFFLAIGWFIVGDVLAALLRACQNHLTFNGTTHILANATNFSQYIQCIYQRNNDDGSTSQHYCWYDVSFLSLSLSIPVKFQIPLVPEL
ncbi:hypothetical protein BKA70DRAFT_1280974, partial [Coprinopsis sp. MPI-PUGE-AT-0042]